jgi:hypothetical protein
MVWFTGIRLRLIDHWNLIYKQWSFIFTSIGTALLGYLTLAPDAIINLWLVLPTEVQNLVPEKFALYIPLVLCILGWFSKYIKQQKLDDLKAKENGPL